MQLNEPHERYLVAEIISAMTFIVMAISIWIYGGTVDQLSPPFWMVVMGGFGLLQFFSIRYNATHVALRLIMSWVVGTSFCWIAYANHTTLLAIPVALLGIANFFSFVDMCGRVTFNKKPTNEQPST